MTPRVLKILYAVSLSRFSSYTDICCLLIRNKISKKIIIMEPFLTVKHIEYTQIFIELNE